LQDFVLYFQETVMAMHLSTRRWQDQVILLLGVWLCVSPWVMAYPSDSPPAVNAYIAGAIMAVLAAFDLYKTYAWAVFLNIVVGVWVAVSPWLVDVISDRAMSGSMLAVGLATVVLGLWELRTDPDLHQQWAGT
jgi:4-amino-4-deoxy-L-arabinose transferase-like glycosyltransferase